MQSETNSRQTASAAAFAIVFLISSVALAQSSATEEKTAQWKGVQEAIGRPGKLQPDGVFTAQRRAEEWVTRPIARCTATAD